MLGLGQPFQGQNEEEYVYRPRVCWFMFLPVSLQHDSGADPSLRPEVNISKSHMKSKILVGHSRSQQTDATFVWNGMRAANNEQWSAVLVLLCFS